MAATTNRFASALLGAGLLLCTSSASATGMQGHMYCSEIGLNGLEAGELKSLLSSHRDQWLNGSFLPDSGYAASDPYGELSHWEEFTEAYIKYIRANYPNNYKTGKGAEHVAVLMGAASHGLVDQTFDILFMDRAVEEGDKKDDIDTGIDIFVVKDANREENPPVVIDASTLSGIFQTDFGHSVSASTITGGMNTAKSALAATIKLLAPNPGAFEKSIPWTKAHYLRTDVPGAYPHNGEMVTGLWKNLWKRLEGSDDMSKLLVGRYPRTSTKFVPIDHTKSTSFVTVFPGFGLKRTTLTTDSVYLTDAAGKKVDCDLRLRGDKWATTVQLKPKADYAPLSDYTFHMTTAVQNLHDVPLQQEIKFTFKSGCLPSAPQACAPDEPPGMGGSAGSAGSAGAAGSSAGSGGAAGSAGSSGAPDAGATPASSDDGGCAVATGRTSQAAGLFLLSAAAIYAARLRQKSKRSARS